MSLVNDMLRDLETRRAAPTERLKLEGLQAVDEAGAARRERSGLLRRSLLWLVAVGLVGLLLGVLILGSLRLPLLTPSAAQIPAPAAPVPAPVSAQVLEVLPQHDGRGLVLQLLLDRSVAYVRSEENSSVSLRLSGVQLTGTPQQGRLQRDGRTLSWRVENQGPDVQVLLLGLDDGLEVRDRLEPAGNRWLLWIEVPLTASVAEAPLDLDQLPLAEPATVEAEPPLPAWASAPVPAAQAPEPSAPARAQAEPVSGPSEVKVVPHQPDALAQALEFLQDGRYPQAIRALEALHQARAQDPEILHWLARAYLAGGEQQRLLSWLPAQVRQLPHDSELRLLLARAQLQATDSKGAVATLEQNPPALLQEPNYHALLAASYQQTGQWRDSVALYRQLIELRPGQSTWQLGLAIGLEQLDQGTEAGRHYRQALQGQGLDEGSRRFASERASALGADR